MQNKQKIQKKIIINKETIVLVFYNLGYRVVALLKAFKKKETGEQI